MAAAVKRLRVKQTVKGAVCPHCLKPISLPEVHLASKDAPEWWQRRMGMAETNVNASHLTTPRHAMSRGKF